MMMRRAVTTVVRRRWISPRPVLTYRCTSSRWIHSGGTIIEAEIVSPLKNDLQEALLKHEQLVSSNNDADTSSGSPSIQSSLEKIRNLRFQMEEWSASLEIERDLREQYYHTPLDLARSHNRFGILHQRLEEYEDSQRNFEASLHYYQLLHPNTFHADVGEAWNALAVLAAEQTELEVAMNHLHLAEPHFRYADKHMFQGDLSSDDIEPHPELRKILENRGDLMRMLNQHREALVLYREIEERLQAQGEPADRSLLLNTADCLLTIGDHKQAKKLYQLVLQRHEVDPDSLMAAAIHHQLGLSHVYVGKSNHDYAEKALEHFSRAYILRKRLLGDTHTEVGKTANAMGAAQASLENPGSALANFREALVVARIHSEFPNDEDDPEVKHIMQNIAMVQKDMEQSTFQL